MDCTTNELIAEVQADLRGMPLHNNELQVVVAGVIHKLDLLGLHLEGLQAELPAVTETLNSGDSTVQEVPAPVELKIREGTDELMPPDELKPIEPPGIVVPEP